MSSISARSRRAARLLATAAAASLAFSLAAGAQDGDEAEEPAVDPAALCGASFAESGASSNVEYAGMQLAACDALVISAHTANELLAAEGVIISAHEGVLARWQAVNDELTALASMPGLPPLHPDEDDEPMDEAAADEDGDVADDEVAEAEDAEEAEAEEVEEAEVVAPVVDPNDPWAVKRAERHAVETGMDGLRILMRLSSQLAASYADPSAIAAALPGPAAARAPEVLAQREVCASAGRPGARNLPELPASWYAFAEFGPMFNEDDEEVAPAVFYEVEVVDDIARIAEEFQQTDLALAPDLGVLALRSFDAKEDCSNSEFPSEHPEDS